MSKRENSVAESSPWRLLLWTALAGLVFGLIGFGEVAEDWLRVARNRLHWHKASGEIVLVKIDDESLRKVGRWPWPRREEAQLVDALTKAGARRIFFDLAFYGTSNPADDKAFAQAMERSQRTVLAVRSRSGPTRESPPDVLPPPILSSTATLGAISSQYNYQNAIWRLPYAMQVNGKPLKSFAALLSGVSGEPGRTFMVDYSIDPLSIPAVSAAEVIQNRIDPRKIRGKDIVVGWATDVLGDVYFVPGTGQMPGAYVHIIGAETLKTGRPVSGGWIPLFLMALAVVAAAIHQRTSKRQAVIISSAIGVYLFAPVLLESRHIYLDVTPGLFVMICVATVLIRRRFRTKALVNPISDLPNLNALRANSIGHDQSLIAARVFNYDDIIATLPQGGERQLIDQIVARLRVGSAAKTLYHGDGGTFAWFEETRAPIGNHLDALYSLFRNPARVGRLSIDVAIAFGVEVGSGRSLANRLASAFVAAEEAAHHGLKWKHHDPESLENASWRLSMLSQLDEAIDRGEVWVAYQPKLDIATRRIIGAEALARWTHREKGPIAASEFVGAAEQHNRIGKLTDFVLEKAVAAAAQLVKRNPDFDMAVNLSARLLNDKGFTLRLSALLARHGLAPNHLTLELTETAALVDSGEALDMINRLRDLGVNIAIDDYGTGQSTLDYLKKIPANEIKIDQSFVKGIVDNRSDRLMVQSTIGLAHSLGRKVVAEGVEHRDILDVLVELDCDIAQGFAVGRPMSLESLAKRSSPRRGRSAA